MLLAGRVRKPEEEAVILSILGKHFKRTVNPENLFSQKQVTSQFSECRATLLQLYRALDCDRLSLIWDVTSLKSLCKGETV